MNTVKLNLQWAALDKAEHEKVWFTAQFFRHGISKEAKKPLSTYLKICWRVVSPNWVTKIIQYQEENVTNKQYGDDIRLIVP